MARGMNALGVQAWLRRFRLRGMDSGFPVLRHPARIVALTQPLAPADDRALGDVGLTV